jgi:hypothetical protein
MLKFKRMYSILINMILKKGNIVWGRYLARAIALAWGGFWVFFGVASGIGEKMNTEGIFMHALLPGLVFLASVVIPWIWEKPGGVLLILEGLFVCVAYPMMFYPRFHISTVIYVLLTMGFPPIVSGIIFLFVSRKPKPVPLEVVN